MPKAKATVTEAADVIDAVKGAVEPSKKVVQRKGPVSYTHLTLPTIYSV